VGALGLEFRILGPLEVRAGGVAVPMGGPRQRALLALLLLSANHAVSRDRLIEELMLEPPGEKAERALIVQVSRLRKALASIDGSEPRLVASSPGYVLRVKPGELDLDTFEQLLADGRSVLGRGDAAGAAAVFREAEALWRGRPSPIWSSSRLRVSRSSGSWSCGWRRSRNGLTRSSNSAATRHWSPSYRHSWPSTRCRSGCADG
jgi:hypothetical protein